MQDRATFSTFSGGRCIASGSLKDMLLATKEWLDRTPDERILIFEDGTGRQVDFDFRGTPSEVIARVATDLPKAGPGRPKLGVVSREISLLPRHWEWLEHQPSGASAALRRLVDEARKKDPEGEQARLAREAAFKFMSAIAGDFPNFEEATRALFAKQNDVLEELMSDWPDDVRGHVMRTLRS